MRAESVKMKGRYACSSECPGDEEEEEDDDRFPTTFVREAVCVVSDFEQQGK